MGISILFTALVLYNCYIYYLATERSMFIYRYILPTIYVFVMTAFIFIFTNPEEISKRDTAFRVRFEKIISWLSNISFQLYLWHSTVIDALQIVIYRLPASILARTGIVHVILLICSFLLTLILAIIFEHLFSIVLPPYIKKVRGLWKNQ